MATIDDLGGAADSLGSVPLGGPNGWAAAVRDAIKANTADIATKTATGGIVALSTDAEGRFTIQHGLGRRPAGVSVQMAGGTIPALIQILKVLPVSWDAVNIQGLAWRTDENGPAAQQPVDIAWTAVGTGA